MRILFRWLLRWIVVLPLLPKAAIAQIPESRGQEVHRPTVVAPWHEAQQPGDAP